MDVGAELEGKVGPFPLYVWLLIATAAAGAYYLFTKKKSGTPTTGTPGTACTQSDGSAGTWDSTGTVCQASTVSTVNSGTNNMAQGGAWQSRVQSTTATATTTPASTATASTPAATASTTPPAATTPTAAAGTFPLPTGRSATPYTTYVDLGWTAVSGANLYHYQVLQGSKSVADAQTTALNARVAGLKSKTQYSWRMATDQNGSTLASPWSSPVSFTTK
jgi:hypothetical protein